MVGNLWNLEINTRHFNDFGLPGFIIILLDLIQGPDVFLFHSLLLSLGWKLMDLRGIHPVCSIKHTKCPPHRTYFTPLQKLISWSYFLLLLALSFLFCSPLCPPPLILWPIWPLLLLLFWCIPPPGGQLHICQSTYIVQQKRNWNCLSIILVLLCDIFQRQKNF